MSYFYAMRTTLAIADDVLIAAKAIARQDKRSVGDVLSDLARRSLPGSAPGEVRRNGILLNPARPGVVVTMEHVNALRDELP